MIRQSHLERINTLMMSMGLDSTSGDTLLQCIMDPSHESLAGGLKGDPVVLSELERLSRDLVYSLYRKRLQLLNADANTVRGRGAGGTRALSVYTGKSSNQRERLHQSKNAKRRRYHPRHHICECDIAPCAIRTRDLWPCMRVHRWMPPMFVRSCRFLLQLRSTIIIC